MSQKKKILLVGPKARAAVMRGVDRLADAVKRTLGPKGRNFASGVRGGPIHISNDGVSLAKEIQGLNEFEDLGVRAVREAATKTNDVAGDGTTTAVVLTQAILKAVGFDQDALGASPLGVIETIRLESEHVVELLDRMAKPVESREALVAVAKVSVENDALAELIAGAQWDVGRDGTVLAEEHNDVKDTVEFIYGVRVDNGFGTSALANNAEKGALELADMPIIITDKVFNTADSVWALNPVFEKLIKEGKTGVILMGRAFDTTALGLCLKNIELYFSGKGGFPIYPINAPYTDMDEVMADLAAVTGAKYIKAAERNVETLTPQDIGEVSKVFTKRYEGIITGPKRGDNEQVDKLVDARVENIKEKLKGQVSPYEKRGLEARLAQLTAGTAIIKVGAETEQERKYKKDKADDAVNTVKAALQEGVVPGGGKALSMIADTLENSGISVLAAALREPERQIVANAGGELEVPDWVQDPLKVVRTAFQKASSIARSLATTEVLVTWEDEKPMWVKQAEVNLAANNEDDESYA